MSLNDENAQNSVQDSLQFSLPGNDGDLDLDLDSQISMPSPSILAAAAGFSVNQEDTNDVPTQTNENAAANMSAMPPRVTRTRNTTNTQSVRQETPTSKSERNHLLAEIKASFDNLQAVKRNMSSNERWGALFGLGVDDLATNVQDNFKLYCHVLQIATKRGICTIPDANRIIWGDWTIDIAMDSGSDTEA